LGATYLGVDSVLVYRQTAHAEQDITYFVVVHRFSTPN